MFYVTMTDKFLSGWGRAEGKIEKFVVICNTYEEAERTAAVCEQDKCLKYIRISTNKPYYNSKTYHTSYKLYEKCPRFHPRKEK